MDALKRFLSVSLFAFLLVNLHAQEQLGLRLDNYSGIQAIGLNPAANANSPLTWDINLVSAGAFVGNNYFFLRNTHAIDALRRANDAQFVPDLPSDPDLSPNPLLLDVYDHGKPFDGRGNLMVMGPSAMISIKGHSIGIYTAAKAMFSADNVPASLGYYQYDRQPVGEPFPVAPFEMAGMAWTEVGLNYGVQVSSKNDNALALGATVKYLRGHEGFFLQNLSTATVTQLPDDIAAVENGSLALGVASHFLEDETAGNRNLAKPLGSGAGLDVGFTYTIGLNEDGYKWKFGAAILDFGAITFNQNAQDHLIDTDNIVDLASQQFDGAEDLDAIIQTLSEQALNDPIGSQVDERFGIWLPAALSLQADVALAPNWYLNTAMVRSLPTPGPGLTRSNIIAVTPRYETRWMGAMVPVSLFQDRELRVGAAFRVGPLTVGSENLMGFVRSSEFSGGDVYAALKINSFKIGKSERFRKVRKGGMKCYRFNR